MDRIVTATFDGIVFHPDTTVDLPPNTRYVLTIQLEPDAVAKLEIDAPPEWSIAHDHYIHDIPNRELDNSTTPPEWSIAHDHYIHDIPKREVDDTEQ